MNLLLNKSIAFTFSLLFVFNCVKAQNLDIDLLKKINGSYQPGFGKAMTFVSDSDAPVAYSIPAGLMIGGLIKKDQQMLWNGFEGTATHLTNGIITSVLKISIGRPRPFVTYPNDVTKYSTGGSKSFPSGHTSTAFATATSISLQYPKWYIITPAYLWASSVGYSRMYLGVHYPSDVLAGAFVGASSAVAMHYTFKYFKKRWDAKHTKEKL